MNDITKERRSGKLWRPDAIRYRIIGKIGETAEYAIGSVEAQTGNEAILKAEAEGLFSDWGDRLDEVRAEPEDDTRED